LEAKQGQELIAPREPLASHEHRISEKFIVDDSSDYGKAQVLSADSRVFDAKKN
jgi:hypothetical protein